MQLKIAFVALVVAVTTVRTSAAYVTKEWIDHVWLPSRRNKNINYQMRSMGKETSPDFGKSSLSKVACNLTQDLHSNLVDQGDLACLPRKLIRPVTGLVMHHKLMYLYPSHVEVSWCTGSCSVDFNSQKSCVPDKVRFTQIPITAVIGTSPSDTESRCFVAEIQEHVSCKCDCYIQEKHCDSAKMLYNKSRCRCDCRNSSQQPVCEQRGKVWDPVKCQCQCPEVMPCSSGSLFHPDQCTCVKVAKPSNRSWREKLVKKPAKKPKIPPTTPRSP